ncbi:uncharacterized protein TM35_000241320 [Trypanosoma theileri]|uniref:Uncharacterized protein n=1 Tax=Trypanosoma theileri TaxID=67003 RepID=A0A1X0NQK2_9TRYP|nr:uncharacterized protein TM35_000241320 [Trypanosoma theileri]ORC86982.1 hypothetical protein TM35_000241320 [Trypanosoma theileri]
MGYFGLITGVGVLLTAVAFGVVQWLRTDKEDPRYAEESAVRREFFSHALQQAISSYNTTTNHYVWGRTLKPSYAVQLHPLNIVQQYTQKKEFVWIGITAGPWLVGLAVLQFNYVSIFSVQFYNAESGESWKSKSVVPLLAPFFGGKWVPNAVGNFGPNAAGHRVEFKAPFINQRAAITFTGDSVHVEVAGSVSQYMANKTTTRYQQQQELMYKVFATASLPEEFLGFVFPLGPRRAALVNKVAAAPLQAPLELQLGEQKWRGAGFLSMDYTRGLLRRETRWYWASATAPDGYGFHLSAGTYDIDKKSVENTFFVSGKALLIDTAVVFLPEVIYVTPQSDEKDHDRGNTIWNITGDGVHLRFRRVDAHDGNFHYGIVRGNLDHSWGIFDGTINVNGVSYSFENVSGVMEEHYAIW